VTNVCLLVTISYKPDLPPVAIATMGFLRQSLTEFKKEAARFANCGRRRGSRMLG
jgi:hypothetical protein